MLERKNTLRGKKVEVDEETRWSPRCSPPRRRISAVALLGEKSGLALVDEDSRLLSFPQLRKLSVSLLDEDNRQFLLLLNRKRQQGWIDQAFSLEVTRLHSLHSKQTNRSSYLCMEREDYRTSKQ
ncbi:Uncharacterized protein Rs2_35225 [Raphanus sativus]|nr:Uncharacterized protein Rs2_35225 [Raphanus sativus]